MNEWKPDMLFIDGEEEGKILREKYKDELSKVDRLAWELGYDKALIDNKSWLKDLEKTLDRELSEKYRLEVVAVKKEAQRRIDRFVDLLKKIQKRDGIMALRSKIADIIKTKGE